VRTQPHLHAAWPVRLRESVCLATFALRPILRLSSTNGLRHISCFALQNNVTVGTLRIALLRRRLWCKQSKRLKHRRTSVGYGKNELMLSAEKLHVVVNEVKLDEFCAQGSESMYYESSIESGSIDARRKDFLGKPLCRKISLFDFVNWFYSTFVTLKLMWISLITFTFFYCKGNFALLSCYIFLFCHYHANFINCHWHAVVLVPRSKDAAGQFRYVDGSRSPSFYTASPAESDIETMTGDFGKLYWS